MLYFLFERAIKTLNNILDSMDMDYLQLKNHGD